jgi:hypothetical protein
VTHPTSVVPIIQIGPRGDPQFEHALALFAASCATLVAAGSYQPHTAEWATTVHAAGQLIDLLAAAVTGDRNLFWGVVLDFRVHHPFDVYIDPISEVITLTCAMAAGLKV